MIYIHKGDCTVFADCTKFLTFIIKTHLDLTGWSAKFILGNITKEFSDISSGTFEVVLSSKETRQLKNGPQNGAIILTDNNGNVKTITNTLPFEVTSEVIENANQSIELSIPKSTEIEITMQIGNTPGAPGEFGNITAGDNIKIKYNGEDLEISAIVPTKTSELTNDSNFAYSEDIPTKISDLKNDSDFVVVDDLPTATSQLVNDSNFAYSDDIPTKTSQLENDSDFAQTKDIPTLLSQLKNDLGYQTLADVMALIAQIPKMKRVILEKGESLPETGEKMTLYFVPKEGSANDVYNEYIWIEETSHYEFFGTTQVDLTDYVKNTDFATQDKGGVVKLWTSTEDGNLGLNISTEE